MEPTLVLVKARQKMILEKMLMKYQLELTGKENPEKYKHLGSYWEKKNRKPYFIAINTTIVGFVLLNNHTLVQKDGYNVAEFYIKKAYRNKGIGKKAVYVLFNLFPGRWEIRQLDNNITGQKFWNNVVDKYTNHNYKEISFENEKWRGIVQIFDNRKLVKKRGARRAKIKKNLFDFIGNQATFKNILGFVM